MWFSEWRRRRRERREAEERLKAAPIRKASRPSGPALRPDDSDDITGADIVFGAAGVPMPSPGGLMGFAIHSAQEDRNRAVPPPPPPPPPPPSSGGWDSDGGSSSSSSSSSAGDSGGGGGVC